jgi:hypothetical protein
MAAALAASGFVSVAAHAANTPVPGEKCNAAWEMASPNGDTIAKGKDVPFVLDFTMVDSDNDATISADEFNKACAAGKVQADAATVQNMK